MEIDDRTLPLTRGQLDIWLSQEMRPTSTEWQLGLFVRIEGTVEHRHLEWAIRRVLHEAEPFRAAIFEVDGQVYQRAIDYPKFELPFFDLSCSPDPVQEAHRVALSIQRTPMSFTEPLFRFALFQTQLDEFYLFACGHHVVIDGSGVALVSHRIASVYSAIAAGAPIPAALFGSLQDLVDYELEYEASKDYLEDQAYWTENLPAESGPRHRPSQAAGKRGLDEPSAPVRLDPVVVRGVQELSQAWGVPRSSVITAACALLLRGRCGESSEVVLDFPVSRRVHPASKTLPGMVAGVVPLVLRVSPGSTVADFCQHVDTRIREAVRHQRFPAQALERQANSRSAGQPAERVIVDFFPSVLTLDFGGVAASASYTNLGLAGSFGLLFSDSADQLFLSTMGAGGPFAALDVGGVVERLRRVLAAMVAEPERRLSSVDVLDEAERARVDEIGHRAVLTEPVTTSVSIPVVFAAQVGRTPEAVAISCGERWWTYRELDEASNRLAHLLVA
ncbi:MAG: hypothetical protein QOH91_1930, partial [Mycobacterium sp.]|nr:hypothetical protein [Mycobacterium sp.]